MPVHVVSGIVHRSTSLVHSLLPSRNLKAEIRVSPVEPSAALLTFMVRRAASSAKFATRSYGELLRRRGARELGCMHVSRASWRRPTHCRQRQSPAEPEAERTLHVLGRA